MKCEKNDVRSRYTQKIIKDTLLKLLTTKPLKEISVAEICKITQLNRGTFYNHFYDIYDVYDSIEVEFVDAISEKLNSIDISNLEYAYFKEIMDFIMQNIDFANFIISSRMQDSLLNRLIDYVKQKFVHDFIARFPNLNIEYINTLFTYIINGSIGIIMQWLQNDSSHSTENIARLIECFNQICIGGFLKQFNN